jgi:hypothetical protein
MQQIHERLMVLTHSTGCGVGSNIKQIKQLCVAGFGIQCIVGFSSCVKPRSRFTTPDQSVEAFPAFQSKRTRLMKLSS